MRNNKLSPLVILCLLLVPSAWAQDLGAGQTGIVSGRSGGSGGGAPTGNAGGNLAGTYPNPTIANVQYLSSPGATTDDTAALNTALASGGTVVLAAGTYALKTPSTAISILVPNTTLTCLPGAIIQAQTGFTTTLNMIGLGTAANQVTIQGCKLDGNSIAQNDILTNGQNNNIQTIRDNEITGATSACITGGNNQVGPFTLTTYHNNIHDCAGPGFAIFTNVKSYFDNNTVKNVGTGGTNTAGIQISYASVDERSHNVVTGSGHGAYYAFEAFEDDSYDWEYNQLVSNNGGMHCDTCGEGRMEHNYGESNAADDYFAEIGSSTTVNDNYSNGNGGTGIVVGSGSSQTPASLRNQVNALTATTGITAATNVTLTACAGGSGPTSSGCISATTNGSFTTGVMLYQTISSAAWNPYTSIWFYNTASGSSGDFSLVLSQSSTLATRDIVIPLDQLGPAWQRLILPTIGFGAVSGTGGPGILSWGIVANVIEASNVIYLYDLERSEELMGYTVTNNRVSGSLLDCVIAGTLQGGTIQWNTCDWGGGSYGYLIRNSFPPVTFGNNSVYYPSAPTTAGNSIADSDASASANTVIDGGGNFAGNVSTVISTSNGGAVTALFTCAQVTNCSSISGLTATFLPIATSSTAIGNSVINDDGAGDLLFGTNGSVARDPFFYGLHFYVEDPNGFQAFVVNTDTNAVFMVPVSAPSLALSGSAPTITASGTTPYINESANLVQTQQCSFALTTSTLTLALSPVNLCTITLPNAAVVWRVNCQGGWSVPAGTTPTFAVGNNWAQTPSGVFGAGNIDTTNAGVGVEGTTSSTSNGNIVATGALTTSATIFTTTWWTTFAGSATSGAYHPTATLTGSGATGTLVGFCTIQ